MDKKPFHIPFPDNEKIEIEIRDIVSAGLKPKESFLGFLKNMYRQVGFRHVFIHPIEGLLLILSVLAIFIWLTGSLVESSAANDEDMYALIFSVSPLLYVVLTFHFLWQKLHSETYEVEMASKYNVYQVTAFRMLAFSVVSILINTFSLLVLISVYSELNLLRAMMISTTALFLFSVVSLWIFMKRRTVITASIVIISWITGNIALTIPSASPYPILLLNLPIPVYAIVLTISITLYLKSLAKLISVPGTRTT